MGQEEVVCGQAGGFSLAFRISVRRGEGDLPVCWWGLERGWKPVRKVRTILQVHTLGCDAYMTEGSGGLGEDKGRLPRGSGI